MQEGRVRFMNDGMRAPLAIAAYVNRLARRILKRRQRQALIDWRETAANMISRFVVGLAVGGVLCLILTPIFVWPDPTTRRSVVEQLGGWIFWIIALGPATAGALTTRVVIGGTERSERLFASGEDSKADDRVKTGCMGILVPIAVAAHGIYRIVRPRRHDLFGRLVDRDFVIGTGIAALGIAVFVHAFGFVPYARFPVLKYTVATGGVAVFLYGLTWPH